MASELARLVEKEFSEWLDEDWDALLEGCTKASDLTRRILEIRDEKYAEIDSKYAAPMHELLKRVDQGDPEVEPKYLEYLGLSKWELEDSEQPALEDVPDDWEPEESWNGLAEGLIGNSVEEEEEETRGLLEAAGILDSYELADGVYRKKS